MKKPTKKAPSKGLGDTVEKITKVTGIKKAVELFSKATGIDCGCDERQEKLNKLFPYNGKVNCLKKEDYDSLTVLLSPTQNSLSSLEQATVSEIYFNVFNVRIQASNCNSCWIGKMTELRRVYDQYEKYE
jgi:hypothetical protein